VIAFGSVYPAAINTFGGTGQPETPAAATLTIVQPDQAVLTFTLPDLTIPAPGQLTYQFVPVQPGHHTVSWLTTSPNLGYSDVFDVSEPISPAMLSLADAKQQLGMAPSYIDDDDELRQKLAALTAAVELYKHEVIVARTIVEEHAYDTIWGGGWPMQRRIRLWQFPPMQLISVTSQDGTITWETQNFDLDTATGLVSVIQGPPVRGRVEITYTAGYKIIPYNYLEGAKILLMHMWESRRGPGGLNGVIGPEELADFRHFTALPRKVTETLGPPRPVIA
jgi:hypothetical protein